jgi:hypothetical protein
MDKKSVIGKPQVSEQDFRNHIKPDPNKICTSRGMASFESTRTLMELIESGKLKTIYGSDSEHSIND